MIKALKSLSGQSMYYAMDEEMGMMSANFLFHGLTYTVLLTREQNQALFEGLAKSGKAEVIDGATKIEVRDDGENQVLLRLCSTSSLFSIETDPCTLVFERAELVSAFLMN